MITKPVKALPKPTVSKVVPYGPSWFANELPIEATLAFLDEYAASSGLGDDGPPF